MKLLVLVLLAFACLALADDASSKSIPDFGFSRRICFLKPDPGPCKAAFVKWFYNRRTRRCEKFIYGGCKGNANRFNSKEDCLKRCRDPRPINKCKLKPDPGPCRAAIPRWFFNPKTGKCEQFTYGGCGGNSNNFKTKAACEKSCRRDCRFFNCFVNPCEVTKCKRFPDALCVPNFCNGCFAEFYQGGSLVKDCDKKPPPPPKCGQIGDKCTNLIPFPRTNLIAKRLFPCCKGLRCCVCGRPVEKQKPVPVHTKIGTCQNRCICPIG